MGYLGYSGHSAHLEHIEHLAYLVNSIYSSIYSNVRKGGHFSHTLYLNKAYTWLCQIERPLSIHYSTIIERYTNPVPVYPTE